MGSPSSVRPRKGFATADRFVVATTAIAGATTTTGAQHDDRCGE